MDDTDEAPLILPPTPRNPEPVHEPQVEETQTIKTESDMKPSAMQLALERMKAKKAAKANNSRLESSPNEQIITRESNPALARSPSPPVITIPGELVLPSTSRDIDNDITSVLDQDRPSTRTPRQASFSSISSTDSNHGPVRIKEEPLEEDDKKTNKQTFKYREHGMLKISAAKENLKQEFFVVVVALPKWNAVKKEDYSEAGLILIRDYEALTKIRCDDGHFIDARFKENSSEIVLDLEVTGQVMQIRQFSSFFQLFQLCPIFKFCSILSNFINFVHFVQFCPTSSILSILFNFVHFRHIFENDSNFFIKG